LLLASRTAPVPSLTTETLALGTTAPLTSDTTPAIEPNVLWVKAVPANPTAMNTAPRTHRKWRIFRISIICALHGASVHLEGFRSGCRSPSRLSPAFDATL